MRASLLLAPVFLLGCTEGLVSVKDAATGDEANSLDDTDTGNGGGNGGGGDTGTTSGGGSSGGSGSGGSGSGGSGSGGSGSGTTSGSTATDDDADGFSEDDGDCNDRSTAVSPVAPETCNGRDDNCNGQVDEGVCGGVDTSASSGGGGGGGGGGGDWDTAGGWDTGWGGGGGGTGGGLAERYLVGSFTTSGRSYSRGQLGLAFLSAYTGSLVCDFEGSVTYQRAASTPCPDCTWTFDLSPVTGSRTVAGSSCGALGFSSGILDGAWDYSWGFAPMYYMYGYGLFLYDAVMIDAGGYWAPVAYNLPWYGVYGTYVSGSTVEFAKPFADAYGSTYFYY